MSATYTALDLSRLLGVPDSTVRSWAKRFPEFVGKTPGRTPRYTEGGRAALERIRDLYAAQHSTDEIRDILSGSAPMQPDVLDPEPPKVPALDITTAADRLAEMIREQLAAQRADMVREVTAAMRDELRARDDRLRQLEEERVKRLDQVLGEWRAERADRSRPFWQRWFRRSARTDTPQSSE